MLRNVAVHVLIAFKNKSKSVFKSVRCETYAPE